jgi:hypothetical protein
MYLKKGTASSNCRYDFVLKKLGIQRGGKEKAVSAVPKEVENIHAKGIRITSAPKKSTK